MKNVLGVAAARKGRQQDFLALLLLNVKMRSTIEAAINHHHWSLTTLYTKDLPTDPTEKERKALLWDFMRFFNLWQDHELRLSAPSRSHPYASNFSMTTAVRLAEEAGVDVHANLMRLEDSTQLAIVDRQIDQLWEGKATWRGIPFIALLEDSTRMDTAGAVHLLDCRMSYQLSLLPERIFINLSSPCRIGDHHQAPPRRSTLRNCAEAQAGG